jgi:hypothetical protein
MAGFPTNRSYSFRISSPPATWRRRRAMSNPATRSQSGDGPGRPVRHSELVPAGGGARDCDRPFPERLRMAREKSGAETINYEEADVLETLKEMTAGRGANSCIDAVGMESHGHGLMYAYDRAKQAMMLESDRAIALRQAIMARRNGGTGSIAGVYGGADRQSTVRFADEPLAYGEDRPSARASLSKLCWSVSSTARNRTIASKLSLSRNRARHGIVRPDRCKTFAHWCRECRF